MEAQYLVHLTLYIWNWIEETPKSAYRTDNPKPEQEAGLFKKLDAYQDETLVEFYEIYNANKSY